MDRASIQWNASLVTGNEDIDRQHQHLFEVFGRLRGITSGQDKTAESASCISEMLRYLNEHFTDEEGLMRRGGYADLERHLALHKEFSGKVNDYLEACGAGYTPYADMLEYLEQWLSEHIMVEDMRFLSGK